MDFYGAMDFSTEFFFEFHETILPLRTWLIIIKPPLCKSMRRLVRYSCSFCWLEFPRHIRRFPGHKIVAILSVSS
jgi:hypothetical protein